MSQRLLPICLGLVLVLPVAPVAAMDLEGEGPALGDPAQRITQPDIESGTLTLDDIRTRGLEIFSTPFNQYDGFGDGPMDPLDPLEPGGRPSLQGNGTFIRINGLDGQSCLDCHGTLSAATIPATFGIGGSGGISASPLVKPRILDVEDSAGAGIATFDGRLINPPALFGMGGPQLLGKEMTEDLQALKEQALANPGQVVRLETKRIHFGTIVADAQGNLDTTNVEGVDDDLVIRPFGRKGEFVSAREFDQGALMFHFGMQPVEIVGDGVDDDGDGVINEILVGELSAIDIFLTNLPSPRRLQPDAETRTGFNLFHTTGCADCHRPSVWTRETTLNYSFPEVPEDPSANVYYSVDLANAGFATNRNGGLKIPLFSDLKRHDMGPELAESFHGASDRTNREFITAKLWGVADSAPYLHDGRALTLNRAIELHGGEAETARDAYLGLSIEDRDRILKFLHTLRNPETPNADLLGGP